MSVSELRDGRFSIARLAGDLPFLILHVFGLLLMGYPCVRSDFEVTLVEDALKPWVVGVVTLLRSFGVAGVLSFNGNKLITTGGVQLCLQMMLNWLAGSSSIDSISSTIHGSLITTYWIE